MISGSYRYLEQDRVVFGKPAREALVEDAEQRGCSRLLVVTSRSPHRTTPIVQGIVAALGRRVAGLFEDCAEHTPRDSVLALARAARETNADLLVTVGGGSAIDAAKVALICLAHDITDRDGFDELRIRVAADGSRMVPRVKRAPIRQIAVPTTLSGAEFSDLAGCTDTARGEKHLYTAAAIEPATVILDPRCTLHTPERLWLSTGIRAVDHAVESICSPDAQPLIDATCLEALVRLCRALPRTKEDPADLEARLDGQLGVWLACTGVNRIRFGASHGIGHVLGGELGIPHGVTSCILLPAVLRYNAAATQAQQDRIADRLGWPSLPEGIAALVRGLGLPSRLSAFPVDRDVLARLATKALGNPFVRANPRTIDGAEQVTAILEDAW
ncbi:iron-containing alcohol dehydrogenase [Methylobacterium oryzisoli]|uniref:iron-containing alcohol dehydrogenase n=1 Tax=Methylobacterium oryzisoli TaxID=3385502 RepID=UPI003892AD37